MNKEEKVHLKNGLKKLIDYVKNANINKQKITQAGLCPLIEVLHTLTNKETNILRYYFAANTNKPGIYSSFYAFKNGKNRTFYYKPGNWKARLRWLEKQLKKLN
jgi:hypothetical protein